MSETRSILETLFAIEQKGEKFRRGSKVIVYIAPSLLQERQSYEIFAPVTEFVYNIFFSHVEVEGTRWDGKTERNVREEIPLSPFSLSFEEKETAFIFTDGANVVTICK